MTVKPVETRILEIMINTDEPLWPLDVARALKVPYGTVYGTLRDLYDRGLAVGVTEKKHLGRPARVLYRLTAKGRTEASDLIDDRNEGGGSR
jgi:DNA-binding PadR family transcriptional regulator